MSLPIVDSDPQPRPIERRKLEDVVIRFAGDSGDGMQLTGTQFTNTSALVGNDLATFPDFPAEIRAPAGTLPGVSAFQVRIADHDIHTPGDAPDVLVAMNPAALKTNLGDLKRGRRADRQHRRVRRPQPQEGRLRRRTRSRTARSTATSSSRSSSATLTRRALADSGLDNRSQERCKNFFALGMCYWMFSRPLEPTIQWLEDKFKHEARAARRQRQGAQGGLELLRHHRGLPRALRGRAGAARPRAPTATSWATARSPSGLVAASRRSGLPLFQGAYPITPASDVLHELSTYKQFGVTTFQAEDEIAAICAAIGAAYGGALARHHHQRPGHRAQERGDEPGADGRAAGGDHRHPARRPVDRPADQDRAGRPAAGDVRPQQRVAAAGRRRVVAGRLLRRPRSRPAASRSST